MMNILDLIDRINKDKIFNFLKDIKRMAKALYLYSIFRKVKGKYPKNKNGKKIIFHLARGFNGFPMYFEGILAHMLNLRGSEAKLLVCDGILTNCDTAVFNTDREQNCSRCKKDNILLNSLNLSYMKYSEFISKDKIAQIENQIKNIPRDQYHRFSYDGIPIGRYAASSTIRYFLKGILDEEKEETWKVFKESIVNAMIVFSVAKNVYEQERPDIIVTSHGIYSTWGPFFEFFKKRNIKILTYGKGLASYRNIRFNINNRIFVDIARNIWETLKCRNLTRAERQEVEDLIKRRKEFRMGDVKHYRRVIKKKTNDRLKDIILNKYEKKFAMFTNLPWDASLIGQDKIFNNAFQWIKETLDFFIKNHQFQLIIKVHPSEIVWNKQSYSFSKFIKEEFDALPRNITILPPNTSLKAYDLFPFIDCGIVYNGTLGLEMAIEGIPVLMGASSHYQERGIVAQIKSRDEYFRLLNRPEPLKLYAQKNQVLAQKYAYVFFIKSETPMPFMSENKWAEIDWSRIKNVTKSFIENDTINHLCQCILERDEVGISEEDSNV